MFSWLKEKTSSKSLFGKNSMFAEATKTLADSGFKWGDISFSTEASVGIADDEYIKLGILAGFIWLVTRK